MIRIVALSVCLIAIGCKPNAPVRSDTRHQKSSAALNISSATFELPPDCRAVVDSAAEGRLFAGAINCGDGYKVEFYKNTDPRATILREMRLASGQQMHRETVNGEPLEYGLVDVFRHVPSGQFMFLAGSYRGLSFFTTNHDVARFKQIVAGYTPAAAPGT